ncbi:hypothetical protein P280DRAFT_526965 [Massarina eburnea CBS 473.64]|uniref:Mid2 domain-containing protein n=1 Tax=Massarina eburnea CBS 473.64 TaxID=1395130 RepID=A0A6A6RXN3_9PLEO|nr:hypothetical protein P280DRAFT_526965 [Massarina eburnea CBS 473.64]
MKLSSSLTTTLALAAAVANGFPINRTPTQYHNVTELPPYHNPFMPGHHPKICPTMNPTVIKQYNATHMQFRNGTWAPHGNLTDCMTHSKTLQLPTPTPKMPLNVSTGLVVTTLTKPTASSKAPVPMNASTSHDVRILPMPTLTSSLTTKTSGTVNLPTLTNVPDLIHKAAVQDNTTSNATDPGLGDKSESSNDYGYLVPILIPGGIVLIILFYVIYNVEHNKKAINEDVRAEQARRDEAAIVATAELVRTERIEQEQVEGRYQPWRLPFSEAELARPALPPIHNLNQLRPPVQPSRHVQSPPPSYHTQEGSEQSQDEVFAVGSESDGEDEVTPRYRAGT